MAYVYRFLDNNDIIIYVGYTGSTLDKRMANHFTRGHLDKSCYNQIAKIEYKKYKTKADAQVMEVFYINTFKPKFNKLNKQTDLLTVNIEDSSKWKTYRIIKPVNVKASKEVGLIWKFVAFGYSIALIYFVLEWLVNLF